MLIEPGLPLRKYFRRGEFPGVNHLLLEQLGYVFWGSLIAVVICLLNVFLSFFFFYCDYPMNLVFTLQKQLPESKLICTSSLTAVWKRSSISLLRVCKWEWEFTGTSNKTCIPEGQTEFPPVRWHVSTNSKFSWCHFHWVLCLLAMKFPRTMTSLEVNSASLALSQAR